MSQCVALDVRSPSEYRHAHIPGALNLPLFDDEERAEVGTIYKNSGQDSAILRGLKFAGEKMVDLAIHARQSTNGAKPVLIHCWRGGMRSQSMGWLLKTAGLEPTVLEGGYKAFRRYARSFFDRPWRMQVVSGFTGAGKTRVLQLLADAGEQVLDLEQLANHRGSAFGGIGQAIQPSTEQFENDLFVGLASFDAERRIWLEDEGNRIGTVVLPNTFYDRMRNSPAVFMDSSAQQRIKNLLVDYGDLPFS
jgi:tRNA 2-selenouridine synthase